MEFIRQRVKPGKQNARQSLAGIPGAAMFVTNRVVKEDAEDGILGEVSQLSDSEFQQLKVALGNLQMQEPKNFAEQAVAEGRPECFCGHPEDDARPDDDRQPPQEGLQPRLGPYVRRDVIRGDSWAPPS